MCGSSDDGSAELRRQEEERQRRIKQAVDAINAVFGVTEGYSYGTPDVQKNLEFLQQARSNWQNWRADQGNPDMGVQQFGYVNPSFRRLKEMGFDPINNPSPDAWFEQQIQALQSLMTNPVTEAQKNRQVREQLYNQTRQNILSYFQDALDKQRQEEEARLRVLLARRGLQGSSTGLGVKRKFLDEYNQRLNELTGRAEAMTNDLRTADEQARVDLISRIQAGMDKASALAAANQALANNANRVLSQAMATDLGDLFSSIDKLYGKAQEDKARRRGFKDAGGLKTPGAYSGEQGYRGRVYQGG